MSRRDPILAVPINAPRPRLLFVVPIALFLVTVRDAALAFFAAMINAEGAVVYSPIMLFQGAPRSHYVADHRLALLLADGLGTLPGRLASLVLILAVAWFWALAAQARVTWQGKISTSIIGFELVVLVANVPFSAAAAYHHVGWGMPCNWQFLGSLLMMNVFIGAIAVVWMMVGAVLWAVGRSVRCADRSRLIST